MCKVVVDVSRHQGRMSWPRAANAGCVAGIARATMGLPGPDYTGVDERFQENYDGMLGEGLRRGAYHLFIPEYSGQDQGDHFLNTVKVAPTFYAVPDVELNRKAISKTIFWDRLLAFCNTVEAAWPNTIMTYTRASFWNPQLGAAPWPIGGLMVAHYTTTQYKPIIPKSWPTWDLWQFSADGNYRGGEFGAESFSIDISRANFRL